MQSIDSIETYSYGTSKYPVSEKEEIKCIKYKKRIKREAYNAIEKRLQHNFPVNIAKVLKKPIFTEQLRWLLL